MVVDWSDLCQLSANLCPYGLFLYWHAVGNWVSSVIWIGAMADDLHGIVGRWVELGLVDSLPDL